MNGARRNQANPSCKSKRERHSTLLDSFFLNCFPGREFWLPCYELWRYKFFSNVAHLMALAELQF